MKSDTTPEFTFLPASLDGTDPCNSLDGLKIVQSLPHPAPVLRFPVLVKRKFAHKDAKAELLCRILTSLVTSFAVNADTNGTPMIDIFGPKSEDSSQDSSLNASLASRLQVRMEGYGSPEYELRSSSWDMILGPPIYARRASARRTSANDSIGWRTPSSSDSKRGVMPNPDPKAGQHSLTNEAQQVPMMVSPWATPSSRDWKDTPGMAETGTNPDGTERTRLDQLPRQAQLAGWATPNTQPDAPNAGKNRGDGKIRDRHTGTNIESQSPVGWNTPRATDGSNGGPNQTGGALPADCQTVSGWCSPMAQDHSRGGMPPRPTDTGIPLSQQAALVSGTTPSSFPAATENSAVSGCPSPKSNSHTGASDTLTREGAMDLQTVAQTVGWKSPNAYDRPRQLTTDAAIRRMESGHQITLEHEASAVVIQPHQKSKLNARFSAWLMGYPESWTLAAESAILPGRSRKPKPAAS